jgi:hypothetical protein
MAPGRYSPGAAGVVGAAGTDVASTGARRIGRRPGRCVPSCSSPCATRGCAGIEGCPASTTATAAGGGGGGAAGSMGGGATRAAGGGVAMATVGPAVRREASTPTVTPAMSSTRSSASARGRRSRAGACEGRTGSGAPLGEGRRNRRRCRSARRGRGRGPGEHVVEGRDTPGRPRAAGDGLVQQGLQHLAVGLAREEPAPGEALPEHRGRGEDVGAAVDGQVVGLLRRHVRQLALHDAVAGGAMRSSALAMPKSVMRAMPSEPTRMLWGETSRWTIGGVAEVVGELVGGVQAGEGVEHDAQRVTPKGMRCSWRARLCTARGAGRPRCTPRRCRGPGRSARGRAVATTLGWWMRAASRPSSRNICTKLSSRSRCGCSTLMATRR